MARRGVFRQGAAHEAHLARADFLSANGVLDTALAFASDTGERFDVHALVGGTYGQGLVLVVSGIGAQSCSRPHTSASA